MGALEMGADDVSKFNRAYAARRKLICKRLDKLDKVFSYIRPNSSYYVFPKILVDMEKSGKNLMDSWKFANELLEKIQVAVVPGMAFGPGGEGHIRLSFGRSEKDINNAFDRLDQYFLK
jgi:aminotransferase